MPSLGRDIPARMNETGSYMFISCFQGKIIAITKETDIGSIEFKKYNFLILNQSLSCDHSFESSLRDDSNENVTS